MYRILYTKQAKKDIEYLKAAKLDKKAKGLVELVRMDPFADPPPYESLVGNLAGFYSRRINLQHRFVYQVYTEPLTVDSIAYEGTVKIVRLWTHYEQIR